MLPLVQHVGGVGRSVGSSTVVTANQFVKYIIRKAFKSEHHLKCK